LADEQGGHPEVGVVEHYAEQQGHEETAELPQDHEQRIAGVQCRALLDEVACQASGVHLGLHGLHELEIHVDLALAVAQTYEAHTDRREDHQQVEVVCEPHGCNHELARGVADAAHENEVPVVDGVVEGLSSMAVVSLFDHFLLLLEQVELVLVDAVDQREVGNVVGHELGV